MKRSGGLLIVIIVALVVVVALIGIGGVMQSDQWSIAEANAHLGAVIPMDAFNINVSGHKGLNPNLSISFNAPPESAAQYAKQLCGGKLYQRYDPFNAIDVDMPSTHAYPIKLGGKTYYSFSTLATDDDWGNRCEPSNEGRNEGWYGYVQVLNDRQDATLHQVKAEYVFYCDKVNSQGACTLSHSE